MTSTLLSSLDLSPPQPQGRDTQGGAREEEGQEEETGHVEEGQEEDAGHVEEIREEGESGHMAWPLLCEGEEGQNVVVK